MERRSTADRAASLRDGTSPSRPPFAWLQRLTRPGAASSPDRFGPPRCCSWQWELGQLRLSGVADRPPAAIVPAVLDGALPRLTAFRPNLRYHQLGPHCVPRLNDLDL